MSKSARNPDGTFKKGTSGNPRGRRPRPLDRSDRALVISAGREAVTAEDWTAIFQRAKQDAIKAKSAAARDQARRFLAEYLLGRPSKLDLGALEAAASHPDPESSLIERLYLDLIRAFPPAPELPKRSSASQSPSPPEPAVGSPGDRPPSPAPKPA